jgi:transposase
MDVVREMDLGAIYERYEAERRGQPPYNPTMMVALLVYAYCIGVPSSRKIERRTYEDVAFRVIAGGAHPDHTRISEFRRIHSGVLAGLFLQVLQLCIKAGLVKLGQVALDGTKMKANASKHKAMSHERMQKTEAELREKIEKLLRAAEEADASEDVRYGKDKRGDELPEELQRAQSRLEKIRKAKAELEAEAKHQAEQKERDPGDGPPTGSSGGDGHPELPSHQVPTTKDGKPTAKAQRNFTDPDSRIQKSGSDYIQGYNAQIAVDSARQIIVANGVTNQPPDVEHLLPILDQVIANCGEVPETVIADAGYFSEKNVEGVRERGADPHIAPGRIKHGEERPNVRGRPPAGLSSKQKMARKLATKAGAAVYARRKVIAEPPFGQIKEARGFRRFLRRGLDKVRDEWALICATHNLLKLHRAMQAA